MLRVRTAPSHCRCMHSSAGRSSPHSSNAPRAASPNMGQHAPLRPPPSFIPARAVPLPHTARPLNWMMQPVARTQPQQTVKSSPSLTGLLSPATRAQLQSGHGANVLGSNLPPGANPFLKEAVGAIGTHVPKRAPTKAYQPTHTGGQRYGDSMQSKLKLNPASPLSTTKIPVASFLQMMDTVRAQANDFNARATAIQKTHIVVRNQQTKFTSQLEALLRRTAVKKNKQQKSERLMGSVQFVPQETGQIAPNRDSKPVMTNMQAADLLASESGSFAALKQVNSAIESAVQVPVSARQTVGRLAGQMGVRGQDVLAKLADAGHRSKKLTDFINADVAELIVMEFGMMPVRVDLQHIANKSTFDVDQYQSLPRRGPVICVMGHVDHGKTTLLDTLRRERRALYEAGNITQSIGAFRVDLSVSDTNGDIDKDASVGTFLDTPGHAAFRAMRERGANSSLTDLIVLVISAVDGIQPQTEEVIELAKQHNVPLIVAINKCDLPDANPQRVKEQLCMYDIVTESMGGDILSVEISAKLGNGIDELKEAILLASDMLDLRAPNTGRANAYVIESRRERSLGCVMNVVVRSGELRVGDHFVCGLQYGCVRALIDERGQRIEIAGPSQGVQILGAASLEDMTEDMLTLESEEASLKLIQARKSMIDLSDTETDEVRDEALASQPKEAAYKVKVGRNKWRIAVKASTPEEIVAAEARENATLYVILKADVRGSLEALIEYVSKLPADEVTVAVLRHDLGEVTESDLVFAEQMKASIIGFNVNISSAVQLQAKHRNIPCVSKDIIYHCMDEIRDQAGAKIPVEVEHRVIGTAEVQQTFAQKKKRASDLDLVVAGVIVKNGELKHDRFYRVRRDDELLYQGAIRSMRHFQKEVQLMEKGKECGVMFDSFNDLQAGDIIECVEEVKRHRMLDDSAARGFETVHNPKYDNVNHTEVQRKRRQAQELKGASTLVYAPANVRQRIQQQSALQ